jgi:hypothetical protein
VRLSWAVASIVRISPELFVIARRRKPTYQTENMYAAFPERLSAQLLYPQKRLRQIEVFVEPADYLEVRGDRIRRVANKAVCLQQFPEVDIGGPGEFYLSGFHHPYYFLGENTVANSGGVYAVKGDESAADTAAVRGLKEPSVRHRVEISQWDRQLIGTHFSPPAWPRGRSLILKISFVG